MQKEVGHTGRGWTVVFCMRGYLDKNMKVMYNAICKKRIPLQSTGGQAGKICAEKR